MRTRTRSGPTGVTDRRFVGALLLSVALIGLLAVPSLLARNLAGTPVTVHVDPPPRAGQCLGPLVSPEQLVSIVDSVPIVPCSQAHSAEIIRTGVIDPVQFATKPTAATSAFTQGSLSQQCDQRAAQFLAWPRAKALSRISVTFFTRLAVPSDLQWLLGQRWYACELLPGLLDYPLSYTGSAANASISTPPAAFANCANDPGPMAVSCNRPHHAEQLTRTYLTGVPSAVDSCRRSVATVIGSPDPTFGGQLAVLTRDEGQSRSCWVTTTSSRLLVGTLINHGTGPLPLH